MAKSTNKSEVHAMPAVTRQQLLALGLNDVDYAHGGRIILTETRRCARLV